MKASHPRGVSGVNRMDGGNNEKNIQRRFNVSSAREGIYCEVVKMGKQGT